MSRPALSAPAGCRPPTGRARELVLAPPARTPEAHIVLDLHRRSRSGRHESLNTSHFFSNAPFIAKRVRMSVSARAVVRLVEIGARTPVSQRLYVTEVGEPLRSPFVHLELEREVAYGAPN